MSEIDNIKEQIEQRLTKKQENKEYKDIGRVAQTKKEKAAYRLISSSILSDLEQDPVMAFNMVKKDNIWQPIDVNLEKQSGVGSGATFLKVKIREALPVRPKDNPKKREVYVHFIEMLQNDLSRCTTVNDIESLAESYKKMSAEDVIMNLLDPSLLKESSERQQEVINQVKSSGTFRVLFNYSYGGAAKLIEEVFGARFRNVLFRDSNPANDLWREAKSFNAISQTESEILTKEIIERKDKFVEANKAIIEKYKYMTLTELQIEFRNATYLNQASRSFYKSDIEKFRQLLIDSYERKIKNELVVFDKKLTAVQPKADDWSWFEQPKGKSESVKEKRKAINTKTPLAYIKRTGGFKIDDISAKAVVERFGFSAVNYGDYVPDKWSKEHTKHFLGAMSDLAEMTNLNIKDINNLGKLSIAFGAKGRPGHLATYFPQTKDINLTKSNGDGSVAHEWGHYFDNVIVELDKKVATSQFASEGSMPDFEISKLFKELMDFFKKGMDGVTPKVPMTFLAKTSQSVPTYSKYVNYSWQREDVKILDTIEATLAQYEDLMKVDYQNRIYSTQRRVFGYIISAFGLNSYEIPLKLGTSYFYHKSAYSYFEYCGKDARGSDAIVVNNRTKYWSSDVELFARAWETVILKKLMDKGRESTYLVADIPMEDVISEAYFEPYPAGKELEVIEAYMNTIVASVKLKFGLGNFVPPSDIREDEYLDLSNQKKAGKVDSGMIVEKISATEEEIVFVENDKVVEVVEKEPETPPISVAPEINPFLGIQLDQLIKLATEEGKKAFENGKSNIPAQNKIIMQMVSSQKGFDAANKIMTAYSKAHTKAALSRPTLVEEKVEVPGSEQKDEDVDAIIEGLEVLLETMEGTERAELEEVIEGLKLLK